MKTDGNVPIVPSKSNKQENFEKTYFLLASCLPLVKKAGSGSVGQWYGSEDQDPYHNVTDPQHCLKYCTPAASRGSNTFP